MSDTDLRHKWLWVTLTWVTLTYIYTHVYVTMSDTDISDYEWHWHTSDISLFECKTSEYTWVYKFYDMADSKVWSEWLWVTLTYWWYFSTRV